MTDTEFDSPSRHALATPLEAEEDEEEVKCRGSETFFGCAPSGTSNSAASHAHLSSPNTSSAHSRPRCESKEALVSAPLRASSSTSSLLQLRSSTQPAFQEP